MKENETYLYVVDVDVLPKHGSEILEQYPNAIGAYLKCFVKAADALEAGFKVTQVLEEDNYTIKRVEEIVLEDSYDEEQWEDDVKPIIQDARNDPDLAVYYGPFYCYSDEPDAE